jgi:hypothetical protein
MNPSVAQDFQAQADRYRRQFRVFLKISACSVPFIVAAVLVPEKWVLWIGGPGVALVVAGLASFFTLPRLRCPDCGKSAEDFDVFCPVCGTAGLESYQSTAAKCGCCKRTLGHYKTRNYRIHFCTHCGDFLDRRGV